LSLFFSVFVVACNIIQSLPSGGTATNALNVTLTLRHPRGPTATATPATPATPSVRADEPAPAAGSVAFEGLRCYMVSTNRSMCLGSVRNLLDVPLEQIAVTLQHADAAGGEPLEQTTWIEQALLLPNASAPYRVIWGTSQLATEQVSAVLARASIATDTARYADIRVISTAGQMQGGRYVMQATLENAGAVDARDVRAILTLRTGDGGVAGYRITRVRERLAAGARLDISIDMIPQQGAADLIPTLYIEALKAQP
jgi:hypothetical protein